MFISYTLKAWLSAPIPPRLGSKWSYANGTQHVVMGQPGLQPQELSLFISYLSELKVTNKAIASVTLNQYTSLPKQFTFHNMPYEILHALNAKCPLYPF